MYWTKIFSDKADQVSEKDCTKEQVERQSSICKERYMKWKGCTTKFANGDCKSEFLEDYYKCVDRLNAMRVYLEYKAWK